MRVYVVWLPMLPGDSRRRWDAEVMNDERVTHLWDSARVSGRWFAEHSGEMGLFMEDIVWDAFFIFDAPARWGSAPPKPVESGSTVIDRSEDLERTLVSLL